MLAGFYVADEGRANPVDVTMALAKGARQRGVRDLRGRAGHRRARTDDGGRGAPASARTRGDIECEVVVNCAGMWARELGGADGVAVPLQAAEHYYLLTEPIDGVTATCR